MILCSIICKLCTDLTHMITENILAIVPVLFFFFFLCLCLHMVNILPLFLVSSQRQM